MSGRAWVRVDRGVFDHEMFEDDEYSRREAWLWLCANAAWAPRKVRIRGASEALPVARGQLIASTSFLASQWGWGRQKVRTFLDQLETRSMIKKNQHANHPITTITICKYDEYQSAHENITSPATDQKPQSEEYKTNISSTEGARARFELEVDDHEIRGPAGGDGEPVFVIDLGAVDMEAFHQSLDPKRCRQIAEQCARDWMANRKRPASPMASVRRAIREERNASDTLEHRKTSRSGHSSATLDNRQEWQVEQDRRRAAGRLALQKMGILPA